VQSIGQVERDLKVLFPQLITGVDLCLRARARAASQRIGKELAQGSTRFGKQWGHGGDL